MDSKCFRLIACFKLLLESSILSHAYRCPYTPSDAPYVLTWLHSQDLHSGRYTLGLLSTVPSTVNGYVISGDHWFSGGGGGSA